MHPILGRIERLAAYLAVWLCAGVLAAGLFTRFGLGWIEALVLLAPLFLVYAFVCLSAWYVSRATPLTTSSVLRVLASSVVGVRVRERPVARPRHRLDRGAEHDCRRSRRPPIRYAQQLPFLFALGVLLFLLALARALRAARVRGRARRPSAVSWSWRS